MLWVGVFIMNWWLIILNVCPPPIEGCSGQYSSLYFYISIVPGRFFVHHVVVWNLTSRRDHRWTFTRMEAENLLENSHPPPNLTIALWIFDLNHNAVVGVPGTLNKPGSFRFSPSTCSKIISPPLPTRDRVLTPSPSYSGMAVWECVQSLI